MPPPNFGSVSVRIEKFPLKMVACFDVKRGHKHTYLGLNDLKKIRSF